MREMTAYNTTTDSDYVKLTAINVVLRGWSEYFKHVSSSRTFTKLDFWVEDRILQWLARKYKLGIYEALRQFKKHQTPTCENIGIQFDSDKSAMALHHGKGTTHHTIQEYQNRESIHEQ